MRLFGSHYNYYVKLAISSLDIGTFPRHCEERKRSLFTNSDFRGIIDGETAKRSGL
jgi:hypothetical protein